MREDPRDRRLRPSRETRIPKCPRPPGDRKWRALSCAHRARAMEEKARVQGIGLPTGKAVGYGAQRTWKAVLRRWLEDRWRGSAGSYRMAAARTSDDSPNRSRARSTAFIILRYLRSKANRGEGKPPFQSWRSAMVTPTRRTGSPLQLARRSQRAQRVTTRSSSVYSSSAL